MNSRAIALRILTEYEKNPQRLEFIIENHLKRHKLDPRDRRLIFEIVYGVIRRQLTLDYIIDQYLDDEKKRTNKLCKRILRIGFYQLLYLDRIPEHAVVNEAVELAKKDKEGIKLSGIINAVLRNFINQKKKINFPSLESDLYYRLSIEFSAPEWMIKRWVKNLGLANTRKLLTFNNERPSIFLRRSLRQITKLQFETDCREICDINPTGYLDLYYRLKKNILPENIRLLKEGLCNIQSPSSGWVVAMLDIKKGDYILDLCSAPGGKSLLAAELCGDYGGVWACEINLKKIKKLKENAKRMKIENIFPLVCDSIYLPFNVLFHKILIDAPCSATGVLHRHPEARWIRSEEDLIRLSGVQSKLLDAAAEVTAPGGVIVYSTCSLEPEENEKQVEDFINRHPEFIKEPCPDIIPLRFVENDYYLKITPFEHEMDGIFAVRLKKKD